MGLPARTRLLRFIAFEAIALLTLFASITIGIRERTGNPRISLIVTTLTISAAVAVGLIPIVFYGPARVR